MIAEVALAPGEVRSGLDTPIPGHPYTLDSEIYQGIRFQFICVVSSTRLLPFDCFSCCANLQTIAFESDFNLSQIGSSAFEHSGALSSICTPSSLERLWPSCFNNC
jgi:hypothetical protein